MRRGLLRSLALLLSLAFLLAACSRDTIVLIPDESGHVGAITITTNAGTRTVDTANTAVVVRPYSAPAEPETMAEPEIEQTFSPAIAARPRPGLHFILYFLADSARLTDASRRELPKVAEAIIARQPSDVSVVGHTDTRASEAHNLRLSQRRAQAVWDELFKLGVDPERMDLTFHGEYYPAVPTEDGVSEPRNRRVEIFVR